MEVGMREFYMIQDKDGKTYIINCGQPSMGLLEISPEDFYNNHNQENCRKDDFLDYLSWIPKYSEKAKMGFKVVRFGLTTVFKGEVEYEI